MTIHLSKVVKDRPLALLPTRGERREQRQKSKTRDTAGPAWFDMPVPERTPELEKDLRLLAMRSALDPRQHYRRGERVGQGKYFQVGTVISDSTGHYADRLTRRQRGSTILDTLMRDTDRQQYLKKKYEGLQEAAIKAGRPSQPAKPWAAGPRRKGPQQRR